MAAKIYTDKDATLEPLKGKTCAVIGFGSQGHAHALNLKDSGVKVIVGLYPDSKSRAVAKEKGFEVMDTAKAVKRADVIFVAVPDTRIAEVYDADGVRRGVVVGVEANPASDLLVLDSGALVPLTFVTTVEANVRIEVDVPEGLFE